MTSNERTHNTHESSLTSLISHLIKLLHYCVYGASIGDVIQVDHMNKTDFDISLTKA